MLAFLVRPALLRLVFYVEATQVAVPNVLGSALGEEVDVVLVVFELVLLLQATLGLLLFLLPFESQFVEVASAFLVGADELGVLLDPGHGLLLGHLQLRVVILHL